jgi:hypothetical protein
MRNIIQKIIGNITKKHCKNCKYRLRDKCTRLDFKGSLCRKGIYPIGYFRLEKEN